VPDDISDRTARAILRAIESLASGKEGWCRPGPEFQIETVANIDEDVQALLMVIPQAQGSTWIERQGPCHLSMTIAN